MASARMARRRRTAILTAFALAAVLILVIIMIIVGISNQKKKNTSTQATATPTNNLVLPTIAPTPTDSLVTPTADDVTPTPTATANDGSRTMYVTGDDVNVRKEASTKADVVTKLAKGTSVTAYEASDDGKFIRIKLADGTEGYMSKDFLSETRPSVTSPTTTTSATPDTSKSSTMYITGDNVNVRKEASASSDRITYLNKGTKVTAYSSVTANGMKWTYIEYAKNKFGYVASKYLAEKAPSVTPTPTPTNSSTPTPSLASDVAEKEEDFLPKGVAGNVGVPMQYVQKTLKKQAKSIAAPEGYTVVYEVEKVDGSYYYIAHKDGAIGYSIYDDYTKIGSAS